MSEHSDTTQPDTLFNSVRGRTLFLDEEQVEAVRGALNAVAYDMRRLGEQSLTPDRLDHLAHHLGGAQ